MGTSTRWTGTTMADPRRPCKLSGEGPLATPSQGSR
jgi:hypothetical protein